MTKSLVYLVACLDAIAGVSAFFRMECRGRLAMARLDPLVDFGEIGSHVHAIHGSSGFSESAGFGELRGGDCTSCAAKEDMSAYWTPSMYFMHEDGTFEAVDQVGGMLSYYLFRDPKNNVKAFPEGFKMIAGSNYKRNYPLGNPDQPDPPQSNWAALGQTKQEDLESRAVGFNCLDYSKAPEASLFRHFMPTKDYLDNNCPDGIRLELAFPSCWNGKDVDSEDHKSHMAYPDLVQDGNCPEGFDTRLVTLFYEIIWNTNAFKGKPGKFVVSNGDPTGFGFHGDFMTGWQPDFLQDVIGNCTNPSGEVSDCHLLTLQTESEQNKCKINPPMAIAKENVVGGALNKVLNALPGNVPVQAGPESATPYKGGAGGFFTSLFGGGKPTKTADSSFSQPTLTYQPGTSSSYPGGGIFLESTTPPAAAAPAPSSAAPSSSAVPAPAPAPAKPFKEALAAPAAGTTSSVPSPAPTPATTPAPSSDPNVSYEAVSTQTVTNGGQVQEIVWEEAVKYVTEDVVTTTTVYSGIAGRSEHHRSHLRRHGHGVHRA
ncbi:WSC domain-containing protein [Apiospora aurea]|uniref:WSC domain-containing protein n=1 Tax=Apiospora aurea TaxID=335848 RepID=A0ABR1QUI8_9PEZI